MIRVYMYERGWVWRERLGERSPTPKQGVKGEWRTHGKRLFAVSRFSQAPGATAHAQAHAHTSESEMTQMRRNESIRPDARAYKCDVLFHTFGTVRITADHTNQSLSTCSV